MSMARQLNDMQDIIMNSCCGLVFFINAHLLVPATQPHVRYYSFVRQVS
jgi:hypothetical protein